MTDRKIPGDFACNDFYFGFITLRNSIIHKKSFNFGTKFNNRIRHTKSTKSVDIFIYSCYNDKQKELIRVITEFGKAIRKLRIDHGEILKTMAEKDSHIIP